MTRAPGFVLTFVAGVVVSFASGGRLPAATYNFAIDPSQSSLTVSGSVDVPTFGATVPLSEQAPGSLTASLSGTMPVDTDLASYLLLGGGYSIVPANSGNWSPAAGGAAGTQPAQFGVQGSLGTIFGTVGFQYAAHDAGFDLSSGSLPVSGGAFDASQLTVDLVAAIIDWQGLGLFSGSGGTALSSNVLAANQLGGGLLSASGGTATLTIPIQATHDVPWVISGFNTVSHITVTGQIVATASYVVPEPAALVPGLIGLSGLLFWACGRGRRAKSIAR